MTPAKTRKHTILMTPAAAERTWSVCPPFCFLDQPLLSPSSAQSPQFGNYLLAINIRIIWRFHHLKPFQNCSLSWHRLPRQRIIWADVHPTCPHPIYNDNFRSDVHLTCLSLFCPRQATALPNRIKNGLVSSFRSWRGLRNVSLRNVNQWNASEFQVLRRASSCLSKSP